MVRSGQASHRRAGVSTRRAGGGMDLAPNSLWTRSPFRRTHCRLRDGAGFLIRPVCSLLSRCIHSFMVVAISPCPCPRVIVGLSRPTASRVKRGTVGQTASPPQITCCQDAPSFHIIDSAVYHTDMDTLNVVPAAGLEQSAHVSQWLKCVGRHQASGPDQLNPMCLLDLPVRSHLKPKASALSAVAFP